MASVLDAGADLDMTTPLRLALLAAVLAVQRLGAPLQARDSTAWPMSPTVTEAQLAPDFWGGGWRRREWSCSTISDRRAERASAAA